MKKAFILIAMALVSLAALAVERHAGTERMWKDIYQIEMYVIEQGVVKDGKYIPDKPVETKWDAYIMYCTRNFSSQRSGALVWRNTDKSDDVYRARLQQNEMYLSGRWQNGLPNYGYRNKLTMQWYEIDDKRVATIFVTDSYNRYYIFQGQLKF